MDTASLMHYLPSSVIQRYMDIDRMKSINPLVLLAILQFMLTGCGLVAQRSEPVHEANDVIADDLVSVFAQLDTLNPRSSVLWIPGDFAEKEPFSAELSRALYDAGYAIRVGGQAGIAELVDFSITAKSSQTEWVQKTYTVTIGEVSVRRSYFETDVGNDAPFGLLPVGGMQVRGADASTLVVDDSRFRIPQNESTQATTARTTSELETIETPAPEGEASEPVLPIAPELENQIVAASEFVARNDQRIPAQVSQQDRLLLDVVGPSVAQTRTDGNESSLDSTLARLTQAPTMNFKELGQSNFAAVLDELGIVREAILTFENDSTFLGDANKAKVRKMTDEFDPASDIFSVIGCSHGKTNVAIGVEGLARGRASRVVQELVYEGVPETKILDEGCWAGETFDERMPRRGVVLTLKRVISS